MIALLLLIATAAPECWPANWPDRNGETVHGACCWDMDGAVMCRPGTELPDPEPTEPVGQAADPAEGTI
jgi:hypothetical protein